MNAPITILILLLFLANIFCQSGVKKNRGQILDMPEWKLVPQLAANSAFFFTALILCLIRIHIKMQVPKKYLFTVLVIPFVISMVKKMCQIIGPQIKKRIYLILPSVFPFSGTPEDRCNLDNLPSAVASGCGSEDEEKGEANEKYRKQMIGYLEYTFISFSKILIIISALALILYFVMFPAASSALISEEWRYTEEILLLGILLGSLIGGITTYIKGTEDFNITAEKIKKNKVTQIKKYLESESAKN